MRRLLLVVAVAAAAGLSLTAGPAGAAELPPVPADFHWGVATSGYQSEGDAPPSNWSAYDDQHEAYGSSVDFLHRYREDIANAASLGVDTFRFGVEWARVEPRPGVYDADALAFYDDVVDQIEAHGMKPMITLSHWVHPAWFVDQGAWSARTSVDQFTAFATRIVQRYAGRGVTWITFNEPTWYLRNELTEGANPLATLALPSKVVQAHNRVYAMIHAEDPGAMVSSNVAYIPGAAPVLDLLFTRQMKLDFLGIDYYYGAALDNPSAINALTGAMWDIDPAPEGLYYALMSYAKQFPDLPIWIVENGMSTDNGKPRADGYTRSDHLRDHIYWMQRAIADGADVIGYNYWSITDNYEWGSYRPRFGLWTVDVATDPALTRTPTDGVATYTDVIARDGNPADYEPVRPPGLCNIDALVTSCLGRVLGLS
ncbi:MAG TPA: family 1 glycosylhydrolase [Aeromicrobium sp.]|nr:family 1 glycosylhydrolase [Aeromicrobium sp.]